MPDENNFVAFLCPNCHQELEAPREAAGQTFACPSCGANFIVPTAPQSAFESSPAQKNAMKSRTIRIELEDL